MCNLDLTKEREFANQKDFDMEGNKFNFELLFLEKRRIVDFMGI